MPHQNGMATQTPSVEQALALLSVGDAERAAAMLRTLLREDASDAEAWHAMACVARAGGDAQSAVALAGRAIGLRPEGHFHITLAHALLEQEHAEPARAAAHVAVMATPRDPRAHEVMAACLEALGRVQDAELALRTALRLRPLDCEKHLSLAACLARQGKVTEALHVSEKALRLAPDTIFAHNQHALLLERAGRMREAAPFFAVVAEAFPQDAAALANYGAALFAQGAFEKARVVLQDSVRRVPDAPETHTNLGLVQMALGALDAAEQELGAALAARPQDARLAVNYGTVLADLGRRQEAEALFRQVESGPASEQDRARTRFNLGTVLLAEGRFEEGWQAFEARQSLLPASQTEDLPHWDGTATGGSPVLLYAEQGLGDTLQFLRYVEPALDHAPVLLAVPEALHSLVARMEFGGGGRVTLLQKGHTARSVGAVACCSLLSLPACLGLSEPYPWRQMVCLPDAGEGMAEANGPLSAGGPGEPPKALPLSKPLRAGLCWAGNPGYRFDRRRSLAPACLAPLADVPGVVFQSLQRNHAAVDLPFPAAPLPEGDLLSTACLMAGLDVVITVDTVIAHLAGVLGKPVWLLNRFGGDWRWAEGSSRLVAGGGRENLWYPSLRLFSQPVYGEGNGPWAEPVQAVADALCKLVKM
ncbi:lipopolysaccharide assembly protein LapB [Acetobacter sp. P1H12_c]|uniref:tetratricopeptide repeat protein n=1 Tax=Acetobacter sp. P1H12_c TaxID=2762621 RepID=UPI001C053778|nr:tetratricopeptide repeat protein [Acetobacter sp. P1H12_c]